MSTASRLPKTVQRLTSKLPTEVNRTVRRLAVLSLIGQTVLVVTGGAVRLTASGLGCPTWPRCTDDSLVNTPEMGIHGFIEFGNRLLTFALAAVAALMLVYLWNLRKERRDLFLLALGLLASIPAQAIIGGITVLSGLNPWVVGLHFLVSMALVVVATLLVNRAFGRTGQFMNRTLAPLPSILRPAMMAVLVFSTIAVMLGVVVTGAGPHAGDADAPRNNLDWDLFSHIHAIPAYVITAGSLFAVYLVLRHKISGPFRTAAFLMLAVTALQAVIGFTQYYNGIPALLVGAHMLGAALLMSASTNAADLAKASPVK
ncbi:heme A synthase [Arthrobacter sp. TES]|uniref:COX15/CtaA family protein n=1 Tax=Paenarthrobacter ureafaciens TaxID=37931 RepID=A0AAX3EQB4_PAEUR|nr:MULTISPECIES: COX15/CtaA family protein [Paenarthrobacter]AMB40568.1 cytochrome oxidase assembly protein [Arthrobacter sp. ATCC 21022]NKR11658.1 cytochrome oxidase assembly protein [Arthrobacter sp. M5]NKR15722.1 cytochrome oxidase assembly protein [Arthrobacter sp. M6]OEH63488.1 cytochrome oxidase assembly protein [Arthrobacter sp. D2]OEH65170.1 cytochrome oxidase assembly protein [Arthrobacter sp. D4]QOI63284.1 heme A synthase [Arthrobacter sp. TES]BCW84366.1 cytochrome b561 [Arthrobact